MLLSDVEIRDAIDQDQLVFSPKVSDFAIQAASVDLTLHKVFWKLKPNNSAGIDFVVNPAIASAYDYADQFEADEVELAPGELLLGETAEGVSLADDLCGLIEGKSGRARHGLIVHCTAPHIAPGWGMSPPEVPDGPKVPTPLRVTLEIVNLGPTRLLLSAGTGIAQLMVVKTGQAAAIGYAGKHSSEGTNS
jgi:deoxycytidine triphosphate deaminase